MKKIIILIIILAVIGYFYSIYDKAKKTIDADDNASKYKVGDTIFFGQYLDKHDDEEKSPIQWIVLQVDEENNRILVVSKYAIDGVNEEVLGAKDGDVCYWKDSKVRTFLNGMFYQRTFSEEEKGMISDTVFTKEDEVFSVKLFIPTYAEVYNQEEKNYRSKATEYAYFNGVETFDKDKNKRHSKGIYRFKEDGSLGYSGYDIYCDCWVLDESQSQITYVTGWGDLAKNYYGYKTMCGVRPALWIEFK